MTIEFSWVANQLKPGTYYARVVPSKTVRTEEIVDNIAKRTLIQPVDVYAVLDALDDEIVEALIEGGNVILGGLVQFSSSLELKDPDAATSLISPIGMSDVTPRFNVSAKPALIRRIAKDLSLAQTATRVRSPQAQEVFDVVNKQRNQYAALGVVEVLGRDLDLPDGFDAGPAQGVFFIDSGGNEYRAVTYINEGNKRITCVVPSGVGGEVAIEVRTNYGSSELRTGRLEGVQAYTPAP